MSRRHAAEVIVGLPSATFLIVGLGPALIVMLVCLIAAAVAR
jgi:hypothetical protein